MQHKKHKKGCVIGESTRDDAEEHSVCAAGLIICAVVVPAVCLFRVTAEDEDVCVCLIRRKGIKCEEESVSCSASGA